MRALKGLVIGMGILILIGFGVVVVGLIQRVGDDGDSTRPGQISGRPSAPLAGAPGTPLQGPSAAPSEATFGDVKVAIPAGAQVVATSTDSGRLVVQLRLGGGATRVLVVDLATGRRLGAIDLAP